MLLELVVLFTAWMLTLYVVSRRQGSIAEAAALVSIACFVALVGGYGIESAVMRKAATRSIGCLVLAGWAAWVPTTEPSTTIAAVGIIGLAIVAATPARLRARDSVRERDFLARHKRWSTARVTLRHWLIIGMIVGLTISVASGLWYSVSSA